MDLEFSNSFGGWVQKFKDQTHKKVQAAVHNTLRRYRAEIESMPVAKYVSRNDKISGISQNFRPLSVRFDNEGAEITIRPFYADARNQRVLSALQKTGGTTRLYREGLFVPQKGTAEKQWQSFATAPRLLEWAQENDEHRRQAVLISDPRTLEAIWGPLKAKILEEINREISFLIIY